MWYGSFRRPLAAVSAAISAVLLTSAGVAAGSSEPPVDESSIQPTTASFGGASPLATTRTVQHWSGQTVNGVDGVTYRYNLVGADPGSETSATIGVDIIPLDVTIDGVPFNGSASVDGVVASPLFQSGDYSGTPATTFNPHGGPLSAGNTEAQLLDATMRSQFDKVGTGYHLVLETPVVLDPIAVHIPHGKAQVMVNSRGVAMAFVDQGWFQTRVQKELGRLHLDPTRLAIFLTKDVMLYADHNVTHCCALGAHGAGHVTGGLGGPVNGHGNQPVHTFVWASWFTAGFFLPSAWIARDIFALSHEVTEWANDPFNTNAVQPWQSPMNALQYGCGDLLETGDPTFGLGFAAGSNTFDPHSGGYFHIQDEALLPWFMRTASTSQPLQVPSLGGRYTFMGLLNPLPWFHAPASPC